MAAILEAMAPYVQNLITDMAKEKVSLLLGVSGEITRLEDNVKGIKAFLADAERRCLTDQSVQIWVTKLKGAMYDATDILDLCKLKADKRRNSTEGGCMEKVPGCFEPLLFCLRNPVFAQKIGSRIKELNQRLDEIRREAAAELNFLTNISSQNWRVPTNVHEHSSNLKTMSEFDENAIVGKNIEKDTKELSQVLISDDNHHDLRVVSIVGMGGMGKTTLSQKIFNEATIQEHFQHRIWLSITQQFDGAELLRSAIIHAGGQHGGEQDMSKLVQTLTNILSVSKFLLVMDDMWGDAAWEHVLRVPVKNACRKQPGSRVLVTTRDGDLALKMTASLHQHYVRPLDDEDAWSLLKKQLPLDQVEIDHLKTIGYAILRKCDGLPLAIKVIGGLLSTKYPSQSEWEVVLNNPAWSVDGLPPALDNRMYLSYQDLDTPLKQCFLYCAIFPKGTSIIKSTIIGMWISEGFIQPPGSSRDDDRLNNVATEYYQSLIKRNLIQPEQGYFLSGAMCTLHDVVRSFAEYMAREEMLVVRDAQAADSGSGLVRRLSVAPKAVSVPDFWPSLKKQKKLRTLVMMKPNIKIMPGDSLTGFSSLRVLYMVGTDSDGLVDSLCDLKHLRFLQLEQTNISRLPDGIHKMKFLEHIALVNCKKLAHLPSSIIKLVHLRNLCISGSNVTTVPKGFGGLINLRSLYGFPVHVNDTDRAGSRSRWCSLQELAPLSQLRELTLSGLEKVPASWMAEKAMISSKAHLGYLELNYSSASGEAEQQHQSVIEEVLEKLCPLSRCLENLHVQGGYAGRQLPNWLSAPALAAEFKNLRYLTLINLPCCTQLPSGLRCLQSLELLVIENAPAIKRVGPEFQAPSSLPAGDTASAPFPKLRELQLFGLCEWEEWEWNDDGCEEQQGSAKTAIAMPCLDRLYIRNCKLSCLPPGLTNINRQALRILYLDHLANLTSVESFPSVVELDVFDCPELKRISGLSRLHKLRIFGCPKLEVLEGVRSLDSLLLHDTSLEALPGYLQAVCPRFLNLACNESVYESLSRRSFEWKKISHIKMHDIYILQD